MVHSNGTRFESHRFKIDFTGSIKYSGFSADFRCVSAGGADAARRAIPTNRVPARSRGTAATFRTEPVSRLWVPCWVLDAGGQSVVVGSKMLPRPTVLRSPVNWSATGASTVLGSPGKTLWTIFTGLMTSGHSGKSPAVVGETWRR